MSCGGSSGSWLGGASPAVRNVGFHRQGLQRLDEPGAIGGDHVEGRHDGVGLLGREDAGLVRAVEGDRIERARCGVAAVGRGLRRLRRGGGTDEAGPDGDAGRGGGAAEERAAADPSTGAGRHDTSIFRAPAICERSSDSWASWLWSLSLSAAVSCE